MNRKIRPEEKMMGQAINWKDEVTAISGPLSPGDTRESWLSRAARRAGVNYRYIRGIWYGEVSEPRYSVALQILQAAAQQRKLAAQSQASHLADTYEQLAESLIRTDPDFGSERAAVYLDAARALRGVDRS